MAPSLRIDLVAEQEAREILGAACGSGRWVERMLARRPFGAMESLLDAARTEWFALSEDDWKEAFGRHPMIGDRDAVRRRFSATRRFSEREQAGVESASDEVLDALAEGNQAYVGKFGYIFIVCATGLGAGEMLARMRARLDNDPATEIRIAAAEHARITELRLRASI
jgi:2-oxo-4-hydroxy-4-carboxy-5-ureidoimidazoline decarboxylase